MTKEEIDALWNKALRESIDDGSLYTRYRFAELVAEAERNKLVAWMIQFGFATGHGDTMEQLVDALGSEIVDRIEVEIDCEREACAKVCDETLAQHYMKQTIPERDEALFLAACADCAASIRARGETK